MTVELIPGLEAAGQLVVQVRREGVVYVGTGRYCAGSEEDRELCSQTHIQRVHLSWTCQCQET